MLANRAAFAGDAARTPFVVLTDAFPHPTLRAFIQLYPVLTEQMIPTFDAFANFLPVLTVIARTANSAIRLPFVVHALSLILAYA